MAKNDKLVTVILCCVGFVGIAGLHRLFRGKILSGLLWLFTAGIFLVGTILDLATLLTKDRLWLEK